MARLAVSSPRRPGGLGRLPGRPTTGALVLVGLTVVCTLVAAHFLRAGAWMILGPWTLPELKLPALVTSTFVAPPMGPFSLVLFVAIGVFFYLDPLRAMWQRRPATLIGWIVGAIAAVWLLDRFVVPGLGYGLVGAVLVLGWVGTAVERRWGTERLLRFAALVVLVVNVVGALLTWLAGDLILSGDRPLAFALMTVWCLMNAHARLAGTEIAIGKLLWVLVAFGALDTLLVGVVEGLMELTAIGLAWALVHGYHRPGYTIDRIKLWRLERRRRSMRGVPGGRHHRRGGVA